MKYKIKFLLLFVLMTLGIFVNQSYVFADTNSEITITTQPADVTVAEGEKPTLNVVATGNGLSYRWEFHYAGSSSWSTWGSGNPFTPASVAKASWNNLVYRCVITDANNRSITSDEATLHIERELKITKQPSTMRHTGGTVYVYITAQNATTYDWQVKTSDSASFVSVDKLDKTNMPPHFGYTLHTEENDSNTRSIWFEDLPDSATNWKVRCVVSDGTTSVTSEEVKLNLWLTPYNVTISEFKAESDSADTASLTYSSESPLSNNTVSMQYIEVLLYDASEKLIGTYEDREGFTQNASCGYDHTISMNKSILATGKKWTDVKYVGLNFRAIESGADNMNYNWRSNKANVSLVVPVTATVDNIVISDNSADSASVTVHVPENHFVYDFALELLDASGDTIARCTTTPTNVVSDDSGTTITANVNLLPGKLWILAKKANISFVDGVRYIAEGVDVTVANSGNNELPLLKKAASPEDTIELVTSEAQEADETETAIIADADAEEVVAEEVDTEEVEEVSETSEEAETEEVSDTSITE